MLLNKFGRIILKAALFGIILSFELFLGPWVEAQESLYDTLKGQSQKNAPAQSGNITEEPAGSISISLKAQDAQTLTTILDYDLYYMMANGSWSQHGALVRSDGIASVSHLKNTQYTFRFFAGGYESVVRVIDINALNSSQKIDFAAMNPKKIKEYADSRNPAALEPVSVELTAAKGRLKAKVKDAITNKPLETVRVSVVEERDFVGKDIVLVTDEKGEWTAEKLKTLPKEDKTLVSFRMKGYMPKTFEIERGRWQEDLGEIALTPLACLEGVLVDGQGRPVTQAEIFLGSSQEFENLKQGIRYIPPLRVLTDENGKFAFEDIEAGEYKILYGPAPEDTQKIILAAGDHPDLALKRMVHK